MFVEMVQEVVKLLRDSDLLSGVSEEELRRLDPQPELISVSAGDTLIRQGEVGSDYYLLVHGRRRVFLEGDDVTKKLINSILPGEGVGEMSLLTDDLTSATVLAMHDSHLVRFSRKSYLQLMESSPDAALQVTRTVIKRLRVGVSGDKRKAGFSTVAVVPIDQSVGTFRFMKELGEQLDQFEDIQTVAVEGLGESLVELVRQDGGLDVKEDHALSAALMDLESKSGILVPPLKGYGTLNFNQIDEIVDVGYRYTIEKLHEAEDPVIRRYLKHGNLPEAGEVTENKIDRSGSCPS
ncbi:MAG: cyclic nucleotide-binding domain-containing protein [Alphaproteobacteria bacterium]|nr:cyclic nucleotide-binding domain-containing protein [Alphaproteobacteria bacterium]MBT4083164.1 cyclic nucleotide-binding domain-containing protein [Alphaproteobacteria bacterium]MBT4546230.1 cyclic nucleotide-binding domain-containing protein [Alphaproteobacteria bacterium]MBT7747748.1 cyclic nucleotide-binding domain-containing protein [Alphaproteobacteria bacterium]